MLLSILASAALVLIVLIGAFFGWLAIMQYRVEPEYTTRAAARGGWVWVFAGLAAMVWGVVRLF